MRIKIATAGEPVLRNAARLLDPEEILSNRIRDLIVHMRETLADAPGVGLAAPQIGEPLQLASVKDKIEYHATLTPQELEEQERHSVPFHVLINPEIELLSSPDLCFFRGLSKPARIDLEPLSTGSRR